jgi:pimeloyl-ACP methyl ester carboxylesterase
MRRLLVVLAAVWLAGCSVQGADDSVTQATEVCRLKGLEQQARCGTISVALNPAEPNGKKIDIAFAVLPALARYKEPDPLFVLAGGPGQSAQMLAGAVGRVFGGINRKRDIVFVDQRGTGESNGLECVLNDNSDDPEEAMQAAHQLVLVRACRDRLVQEGEDTRWYATHIAVKDFDAVRARLGATQINVWGGSYGTRAALEYARQFPDRVRTLILDSVAPADGVLPVSMAVDSDAALRKLVADCEQDAACAKRYPKLAEQTRAMFAPEGLSLAGTDWFSGQKKTYKVELQSIAGVMRAPLYAPALASLMPFAVQRASAGDGDPLVALSGSFSQGIEDNFSFGMHLAVVCAEDVPRIDDAAVAAARQTLFGTAYIEQYRQMCEGWAVAPVPASFYEPVKADLAVLVLSGQLDPVTPPRHGAKVAAWFKRAQHIVVPAGGHIISTMPCADKLVEQFVKTGGSETLDGACLNRLPRPTFYTHPQRPAAQGAAQ